MVNGVERTSRRGWLGSLFMWTGLAAAHGVLGAQFLLYLLPENRKPRTRLLFAGPIDRYEPGSVRAFLDLQGNEILIRRDAAEGEAAGFKAFSSVCPHLGCRVHWEADKERFFCPCHRGVFDAEGRPVSGPPADGNTPMKQVPLVVDRQSKVVYIEVPAPDARRTA